MNCIEFRRSCLTDPSREDDCLQEHPRVCSLCRRFWVQIQAMEHHLHEAMAVDVPEDLNARTLLRCSLQDERRQHWWGVPHLFALAASLLLVLSVAFVTLPTVNGHASLDQEALARVEREHEQFRGQGPIPESKVTNVLAEFGVRMRENVAPVVFAERCVIQEAPGAHMVFTGDKGPITLLLVPEYRSKVRQPFGDDRFSGVILPCPKGSMVIVGEQGEALERIEKKVRDAFDWV